MNWKAVVLVAGTVSLGVMLASCGSRVHDILIINRFTVPVQIDIKRIPVGEPVAAESHAIVGTRYVQMGFSIGVRSVSGKLMYEAIYSDEEQDKMQVDDIVIVEVGPREMARANDMGAQGGAD